MSFLRMFFFNNSPHYMENNVLEVKCQSTKLLFWVTFVINYIWKSNKVFLSHFLSFFIIIFSSFGAGYIFRTKKNIIRTNWRRIFFDNDKLLIYWYSTMSIKFPCGVDICCVVSSGQLKFDPSTDGIR